VREELSDSPNPQGQVISGREGPREMKDCSPAQALSAGYLAMQPQCERHLSRWNLDVSRCELLPS
jgi:hypothetical protein